VIDFDGWVDGGLLIIIIVVVIVVVVVVYIYTRVVYIYIYIYINKNYDTIFGREENACQERDVAK